MKKVIFKKRFTNINEALTKVPAQLKENDNVFEMTDGNKVITVRWEGTLEEGKAVALIAKDETLINEEVSKMKNLMGYKSEDTIGNIKGSGRVTENDKFKELLSTSKKKILIEDSGNVALVDESEILDEGLKSIMAGIMMVVGAMASGQEVPPQKIDSVKSEISKLSPEQKNVVGDKLTPEQKEQIKVKTGIDFTDEYMDDTFAWEPEKKPFEHESAPKLDLGKYGDIKAAKVVNIGSNGEGGQVYTVQVSKFYGRGNNFNNIRSYIGKQNQSKIHNSTIKFVDDTGTPLVGNEITYK